MIETWEYYGVLALTIDYASVGFSSSSGGSVPESVSAGNTVIGSGYQFHHYLKEFVPVPR